MTKAYEPAKWEYPVDWINWSAGIGRPAGIFLLDGSYHIATHRTAAEAYLVAAGALHVATLRFDRAPVEGGSMEGPVDPVESPRAARLFTASIN